MTNSVRAGAVYINPFGANLSVTAGVSFQYYFEESKWGIEAGFFYLRRTVGSTSIRNDTFQTLQVPLFMRVRILKWLSAGMGFALSADAGLVRVEIQNITQFKDNPIFKSFEIDWGWGLTLDPAISEHFGFFLDIRYYVGLTNKFPNDTLSLRFDSAIFTVGAFMRFGVGEDYSDLE